MKISVNHLPQLLLVALMLSGCASTPDSAPSEAATSDKATSSPTSSMLSFYSAGKIQQYCSRIGQVTSDPVALQEAGVCIGYISGIVDREAILVIQGEKDPGFCIPAGVSTQEIVTVLRQLYIREDSLSATASDWIARALGVAYPPTDGSCR